MDSFLGHQWFQRYEWHTDITCRNYHGVTNAATDVHTAVIQKGGREGWRALPGLLLIC